MAMVPFPGRATSLVVLVPAQRPDPGYGYFVASIIDRLSMDRPFTVWESDRIDIFATPSLADESAEMILAIGARGLTGVFHGCGADGIGRMDLALLACDVFDIEPDLLRSGPPDPEAMPGAPIPYDTTLTSPRTSELLARDPTPTRRLLERFRDEHRAGS